MVLLQTLAANETQRDHAFKELRGRRWEFFKTLDLERFLMVSSVFKMTNLSILAESSSCCRPLVQLLLYIAA